MRDGLTVVKGEVVVVAVRVVLNVERFILFKFDLNSVAFGRRDVPNARHIPSSESFFIYLDRG